MMGKVFKDDEYLFLYWTKWMVKEWLKGWTVELDDPDSTLDSATNHCVKQELSKPFSVHLSGDNESIHLWILGEWRMTNNALVSQNLAKS